MVVQMLTHSRLIWQNTLDLRVKSELSDEFVWNGVDKISTEMSKELCERLILHRLYSARTQDGPQEMEII